jgi:hypothetical protein
MKNSNLIAALSKLPLDLEVTAIDDVYVSGVDPPVVRYFPKDPRVGYWGTWESVPASDLSAVAVIVLGGDPSVTLYDE